MNTHRYRVIVTTPSHPSGVSYPSSREKSGYTRDEAIAVLRGMVSRGRPSDYQHKHGCYAECVGVERFTLEDIDGN